MNGPPNCVTLTVRELWTQRSVVHCEPNAPGPSKTGARAPQGATLAADTTAGSRTRQECLMAIHVFAGEDGVSHVNRVKVVGSPKPLPALSAVNAR